MTALTSSGLRWFFAVAAGLAVIAGLELFVGATRTDDYFSWTIDPPLTAAFMGAAYWAACVLLAWAAMQRQWARARTAVPPVLTIAIGLLVATLLNLDRFHHDLYGRFWVAVYVIVVPLLIFLVATQRRDTRRSLRRGWPLPGWLRVVLVVQGVILAGFGVVLYAAPVGAASAWPWPLTPLTARAVASFLVGFAVAAAFAIREDDLSGLRGCALAWAALGALELAAVAIHWSDLTCSDPGRAAYVAFWATVLVVGAYGSLSRAGRAGRPPGLGTRPR